MSDSKKGGFSPPPFQHQFGDATQHLPDIVGGLKTAGWAAFKGFGETTGNTRTRTRDAIISGLGSMGKQTFGYMTSGKPRKVLDTIHTNNLAFDERQSKNTSNK